MKLNRIALAVALAGLSFGVHATNGYFAHGYGMKAKGMAGVSTAMTDNAFFGANNPATAAFAGNRLDLGVDLFSPIREYSRKGSFDGVGFGGNGFFDGDVESDSNYFLIPEFGYNHMMNDKLALGVTVYGNGGMNTDYESGQLDMGMCMAGPPNGVKANMLCGQGRLGVDLMQLIVAPTAAYKIAPNHSIGISPLLGYQRFEAKGLQAFSPLSNDPANLTNNDHDDAFGYGVRVGYYGKITPTFSIGAAYASKMYFEEFDDYKGLFAEQGDFDIPENYNLGVAWQATPALKVAMDYQRINYSGVESVSNTSEPPIIFPCGNNNPTCLGGNNGIGFGWEDIDVWKLGVEYVYNKAWTFRAGYSHTDQPIPSADVTFNSVAPAVIENHVTLGFTYTRPNGDEITAAYMHGFSNDVKGDVNQYFPVGGTDKIEMYQNSLGIQYSWKM
jgi:long-chain fatty acid transport protein